MEYAIQIKNSSAQVYSDLFNVYGVRLIRGCYETLLTPPAVKDYVTNETRLQHGTIYAADGSYNKQRARDISLDVVLEAESYDDYLAKYEAFLLLLTSGVIQLKVPRLKRVFKLVYKSCSKFNFYSYRKATFTIDFTEPDPSVRERLE